MPPAILIKLPTLLRQHEELLAYLSDAEHAKLRSTMIEVSVPAGKKLMDQGAATRPPRVRRSVMTAPRPPRRAQARRATASSSSWRAPRR